MSAYTTAVLADSPVSYWRLDESAGTNAADQKAANPGTYTGGFTLSQTGALTPSGDLDAAVAVNGTTGYVALADSAGLRFTNSFTFEMWVKPTSVNDTLFHKNNGSDYLWFLSGANHMILQGTGIAVTATDTASVATGTFQHLAVTYDGAHVTFYINGVGSAPIAVTGNFQTSAGGAFIGGNCSFVNFFNGVIDEVAVYSTVLSAARILAHYNAATTPPPTPPTVSTTSPTSITATSATLNGTVNPNGNDATVHFEYGTTTGYGTSTANQDAGAGSSGVPMSAGQSFLAQAAPAVAIAPPAITRAQWTFVLADAGGNALAELSTGASRTVALKRNSYTEVNLTLSHQDDAATLLLSAVSNTGMPKLFGYRRGPNDPTSQAAPLRFRGYLAAIQEQSDESSLLTCTFRSPFAVLIGDGSQAGRFVRNPFGVIFTATDAGLIAKSLIDTTNGDSPTGLATDPSLIAATVLRDRTYPVAQSVGQAIADLTTVLDGFDFFETYNTAPGTTDAFFNVTGSLGAVNGGARFEYGQRTLSNVSSVTRTTQPPQNSIFVTGGNGLTSTYIDAASVAKYGEWWGHYDFSTVIEQATLDAKARGLCRTKPIKTVSFVPELALDGCPKPFDDFNLGDTVPFYANSFALQENAQLRINGFTIPISEDGYETASIDDVTSPEDEAVLSASLIAEVV